MRTNFTLTHIPICPYCRVLSIFIDSKELFGKTHGMMYLCDECGAYVGCHKDTNIPLGTIANRLLRQYRKECHELFDPIWKSGEMSRMEAYQWLSTAMNISTKLCHFGMFNEEQCKLAISIISNRK